MNQEDLGTLVKTDVMVIGGGIAALFAAIKAKEKQPSLDVLVVDKCCAGASGATTFAAGVFPAWRPGEEFDSYVKEVITENSEYLMDQEYAEQAILESSDRFDDLLNWGVEFQRDEKGEPQRIQTLCSRIGKCTPFKAGVRWSWRMRTQAARLGVKMLDRVFMSDLLLTNGRCAGAVGLNGRTGEFLVFEAKATVLANGSVIYGRTQMGPSGSTGDGPCMGFRAGAQLRNAEQLWAGMVPMRFGSPGHHVIFGSGGMMVNSKGERFMQRYNPVMLEECRHHELARAIVQEWIGGNGPCYIDITHLPPQALTRIRTSLPFWTAGTGIQQVDPTKEKMEYRPSPLYWMNMGGIRVRNAEGDAGIPGLWVVGSAGDYCGGADSTAVASLSGSAVTGARGGMAAANFAAGSGSAPVDMAFAEMLRENLYQPLKAKNGLSASKAYTSLSRIMTRYVNLMKNKSRLERGLGEIAGLREEFGIGVADSPRELRKVQEVKNLLQVAEVTFRASLVRTESRLAHYREDYPKRDDKNWLKWVLAKLVKGKVEIETEDIPIHKWKFRPNV